MTVIPTGSWLSLPLAAQSVSRKSAPSVTRCLPLSLQGNILFYDYEYILMGLFFYMVDVLEDFSAIKLFKWPWSQLAVDCRFHWLLISQPKERSECNALSTTLSTRKYIILWLWIYSYGSVLLHHRYFRVVLSQIKCSNDRDPNWQLIVASTGRPISQPARALRV